MMLRLRDNWHILGPPFPSLCQDYDKVLSATFRKASNSVPLATFIGAFFHNPGCCILLVASFVRQKILSTHGCYRRHLTPTVLWSAPRERIGKFLLRQSLS